MPGPGRGTRALWGGCSGAFHGHGFSLTILYLASKYLFLFNIILHSARSGCTHYHFKADNEPKKRQSSLTSAPARVQRQGQPLKSTGTAKFDGALRSLAKNRKLSTTKMSTRRSVPFTGCSTRRLCSPASRALLRIRLVSRPHRGLHQKRIALKIIAQDALYLARQP